MSLARQLITENDDLDPKEFALGTDLDSELMFEVLSNFKEHFREKVKKAKASGALSGQERELVVLKACLLLAAQDFFPGHLPEFKKTLNNLKHFV